MVVAQDQQPLEYAFARSGVQSRDNQVPSKGRAHSDVRRFFITDFADHKHLWILTQQMPGGLGKIQSASLIYFSLHHARDDLFGGIFNGYYVPAPALGEMSKTGVYGGGFAAAGRTSQQQQARGLAQQALQFRTNRRGKFQLRKSLDRSALKETENDLFAGHRWIGGDPYFAAGAHRRFVNPAILRQRFLVRLEARQKLNTAKDTFGEFPGELGCRRHHPIEPERNRGRL